MSNSLYSDAALLNSLFGNASNFGALGSAPGLYAALSSTLVYPNGTNITEPLSANGYARVAAGGGNWAAAANVDPAWAASTPESSGYLIADSNGFQQMISTAGTTGATAPAWNTTVGGTTADGTAVWTNQGQEPQVIKNSSVITFPSASATWLGGVNIAFFALFDSITIGSGDCIVTGIITVPAPVLSGDTATFSIGNMVIELT
ncbi:MAG: phage tail fiber protein [Gammaproteobacteria bacterium]